MEMENYSDRSNARRKAKQMITAGTAPANDYDVEPIENGRFAIVWKTEAEPEPVNADPAVEAEPEPHTRTMKLSEAAAGEMIEAAELANTPIGQANRASDPASAEDDDEKIAPEDESEAAASPADADPFPAGTEVEVRRVPSRIRGVVTQRLGDGSYEMTVSFDADHLRLPSVAGERAARAAKTPRATSEARPGSKRAQADAAAARGEIPAKPDVTSHANHHYQKRFDRLAELAAAGDWQAVQAYECTGINSYAKMVRDYRDRLLLAHAAKG